MDSVKVTLGKVSCKSRGGPSWLKVVGPWFQCVQQATVGQPDHTGVQWSRPRPQLGHGTQLRLEETFQGESLGVAGGSTKLDITCLHKLLSTIRVQILKLERKARLFGPPAALFRAPPPGTKHEIFGDCFLCPSPPRGKKNFFFGHRTSKCPHWPPWGMNAS